MCALEIQSLSIAVPAGCPNSCKYCVAHIHRGKYTNQIEGNIRFQDLYERDYKERLAFARDNGCNTLIFTGDGEPMMNQHFMQRVSIFNQMLSTPFRNIELQTSGHFITDETLRWLRNTIKVNTIALSISSFAPDVNAIYNGTSDKIKPVDIKAVCDEIKRYDFNLRLCLNMTEDFRPFYAPVALFNQCATLGADQITFRVLYASGQGTTEDKWIEEHRADDMYIDMIREYIIRNGNKLEVLPFGATRYAVKNMSVVLDDDCMNTQAKDSLKYLILRENCKLYTKWSDKGSLLF